MPKQRRAAPGPSSHAHSSSLSGVKKKKEELSFTKCFWLALQNEEELCFPFLWVLLKEHTLLPLLSNKSSYAPTISSKLSRSKKMGLDPPGVEFAADQLEAWLSNLVQRSGEPDAQEHADAITHIWAEVGRCFSRIYVTLKGNPMRQPRFVLKEVLKKEEYRAFLLLSLDWILISLLKIQRFVQRPLSPFLSFTMISNSNCCYS